MNLRGSALVPALQAIPEGTWGPREAHLADFSPKNRVLTALHSVSEQCYFTYFLSVFYMFRTRGQAVLWCAPVQEQQLQNQVTSLLLSPH